MILMEFNLDYANAEIDSANIYLFTGNSYIKRNGALVMGRGAALTVRDMYPGIDRQLGQQITHLGFYGLLVGSTMQPNIGILQVKYRYNDRAQLDLIQRGVAALDQYSRAFGTTIHMNYPGIGNGGLLQTDVGPLLASLPDNVFIYRSS